MDEDFFNTFKPDTKPERFYDESDLEKIKSLLVTSLDHLGEDHKAGIFTNYPTWTTRYGVEIDSIDTAIAFLPFHEGLHIGYIMGMRKLVGLY